MDFPTRLKILSLGISSRPPGPRCMLTLQMEAVFAAYRVFSFWRISWRSSVTPMVSTTSLGHANTSIL